MTMDNWGPLAGFSVAFFLLMGACSLFLVLLWITVPFSIFSIRSQLKQQLEVLRRIEQRLGEQPLVRLDTTSAPAAPVSPTTNLPGPV